MLTVLRVYEAFTRGDYIQKGEAIEVIGTEEITLKVKVLFIISKSLLK